MSDIEDNPFKGEVSQLDTSLHQEDGDGFDTVDTQVNGEHGQASSEGRPVGESTPQRPTYPMLSSEPKTTFCCSIDRYLHGDEPVITLTNADKTNEGSGSSYVAYSIRTNTSDVKRRYREFESLRDGLMKLYPTLIIPPIPLKHSIGDYATKQGKAKEDIQIIETRKRMLQVFLTRLGNHPVLKNEHVFHRFLESGVSWNEVLHSPPLSTLPKNILKASSLNPADTNAPQTNLPVPNASHNLRDPDPRFVESEKFTSRFSNHLTGTMEKVTRRTVKRLGDLSHDYAELGAVYNGFSLNENGELANAIEKVGAAVDASHTATSALVASLESDFAEPLQEYAQFSNIIKQVLKYRHLKHLQFEMTQETLETKRMQLDNLEQSEEEARRLAAALDKISVGRRTDEPRLPSHTVAPPPPEARSSLDGETTGEGDDSEAATTAVESETPAAASTSTEQPSTLSPTSSPSHKRGNYKGFGSSKLLGALSHTFQGIMDVDPEATRRNNIGKTRDTITQLEEALKAASGDLKAASQTIQVDLDRFQRMKVADLRDMLIALAKVHIAYCEKNLATWTDAKAEVEKIKS